MFKCQFYFFYFLDYIDEWAANVKTVVSKLTDDGYADEDIGIILRVATNYRARYIMLFQKLTEIFSKTEISLQFDFESLSQEKTVVIVCGLKIWCPTIF